MWLPKSHVTLAGKEIANLPVVGDVIYRKCEGKCHQFKLTQLHHVGVKQFFGEDADQWPMVYFCRECHDEWHTRVTPGLCTEYDASAHAVQLFDYLGIDKARALFRAMALEGTRRKGAA